MKLSRERILIEWAKCEDDPSYFINNYVKIYDPQEGGWIQFELWPAQVKALQVIDNNRLSVVLKARQLGLTWLALAYALWLMIFHPVSTILIFSRRDDDAVYLLGDERLRGIYNRLPYWMKAERELVASSHQWRLSNGSNARAFPVTGGDSYTASMVIVDEADLIQDLNRLMRSTKPTIDAGGKMLLISRVDKSRPESEFKNIFTAAMDGKNGWGYIFLPWSARLDRDENWYQATKADIFHRTGSYDDLYEQYPSTFEEALAPRSVDKRFSFDWVASCFTEVDPIQGIGPSISQARIYRPVELGYTYVIGVDPAEGNPTSDDSALTVICRETGEEVACLWGKFEPAVMASYVDSMSRYYSQAPILVERNNHGHAVLLWLTEFGQGKLLAGWDDKPGWFSSSRGKAMMYDTLADSLREKLITIHTRKTFKQIESIEGSTLRAPEGLADDMSDSFALAVKGIEISKQFPVLRQASIRW